jgi:SpoVK/Ycf46/Vps4 family AAA+-type ATPase
LLLLLTEPYRSSLDHILDELSLLDFELGFAISKLRKNGGKNSWSEFSGLYISEDDIEDALKKDANGMGSTDISNDFRIFTKIQEMRGKIDERRKQSIKLGTRLYLEHISNVFSLSPLEKKVIIICLAPEIDSKYEKLYAYIQNDVTKKRPTVGFILDLLSRNIAEKVENRCYFLESAPLFRFNVLGYGIEPNTNESYLLSRPLKLTDHVVDLILLEQHKINPKIVASSTLVKRADSFGYVDLYEELRSKLLNYIKQQKSMAFGSCNEVFYLHGLYGIGKKTLTTSICQELEMDLIVTDIASALNRSNSFEEAMRLVFLEANLRGAAVYLDDFDCLHSTSEEKINNARDLVVMSIKQFSGLTFIAGEKSWQYDVGCFRNLVPVVIKFPEISYSMRRRIWRHFLNHPSFNDGINDDVLNSLATKFAFTPKQILDAILAAKKLESIEKGCTANQFGPGDLNEVCRLLSNERLLSLAHKVTPRYVMDDIILPANKKAQLKDILNHVKYRNLVYSDWGFESKLSLGKGLNILFAGESGTGKTMAAEIISHELKLDLYKIDVSSVVSKYIGETEKNINRIFKEAETSNAILFFDECDAIFGKRSEIKDSHDRYANLEINYLLQKLEEHKEIVILASNLAQNIDDAFTRRMQFWVDFPFPGERSRFEIWKNIFPKTAPLSEDVDFDFLAKQFSISGGVIKNIAINSAFFAAEESGVISMKHIVIALKREFEKMGKPCLKSDFGKYHSML